MELESKLSLVFYAASWEKLVDKGILELKDYNFYQETVGSNSYSLVDVQKRLLVASSSLSWITKNANYVNEDYFLNDTENFEVINVTEMANFKDTLLMCRMRLDENRIWMKYHDGKFNVNFEYFPNDKSRQASIIEILADIESPIIEPKIKRTMSDDSLRSLLESLDFKEQIDDILNKK